MCQVFLRGGRGGGSTLYNLGKLADVQNKMMDEQRANLAQLSNERSQLAADRADFDVRCRLRLEEQKNNVTRSAQVRTRECAAECRNGPSAEADILPNVQLDIRPKPKPKPNIDNLLANVIGCRQSGRQTDKWTKLP